MPALATPKARLQFKHIESIGITPLVRYKLCQAKPVLFRRSPHLPIAHAFTTFDFHKYIADCRWH